MYHTALGNYVLLGYVGPFEVYWLPSDEKYREQDERSSSSETIQ